MFLKPDHLCVFVILTDRHLFFVHRPLRDNEALPVRTHRATTSTAVSQPQSANHTVQAHSLEKMQSKNKKQRKKKKKKHISKVCLFPLF